MAFQYRRLHAGDAPDYRALRQESLLLEPESFEASVEDEAALDVDDWAQRLTQAQVFGAFAGPMLVGIAPFDAETGAKVRHRGHVTGVCIRPQMRGTSVATELMEALISAARSQVRFLYLIVTASNQRALRFYTRLGFIVFGHHPGGLFVHGVQHEDILMVLVLDAGSGTAPVSVRPFVS